MRKLIVLGAKGSKVLSRAPDLSREAADLRLKREPEGSWTLAQLETLRGGAYVLEATRTPGYPWVAAQAWPDPATRADLPSYDETLQKLEAWVAGMGVQIPWAAALRVPWPGHQNGPLTESGCLEPDLHLRVCAERQERTPMNAVLELVFREGMERGAYIQRMYDAELPVTESVAALRKRCRHLRERVVALEAELAARSVAR